MLLLIVGSDDCEVVPGDVGTGTAGMVMVSPSIAKTTKQKDPGR
ncbi:MAG TPA: hypothetical protein VKX28_02710 [Xanthobacteraceae bacterium]|nr:hypothetical protein [Xanthobacteraceae bacterium]